MAEEGEGVVGLETARGEGEGAGLRVVIGWAEAMLGTGRRRLRMGVGVVAAVDAVDAVDAGLLNRAAGIGGAGLEGGLCWYVVSVA